MRLHRRPRTPEENRIRNLRRLRNPRRRTLGDRLWAPFSRLVDWWCRHVTQRELYRRLDAAGELYQLYLQAQVDDPPYPYWDIDTLPGSPTHQQPEPR